MENYKNKIYELEDRIKALDRKVKDSKRAINVVMSKYGFETGS